MTETGARRAEAAYRGLLHLYPRGFRRAFGPAMACAFAETATDVCARQGVGGLVRLWLRAAVDVASTAVTMRRDDVLDRARRGRRDPLHGLVMRRTSRVFADLSRVPGCSIRFWHMRR